MRIYLAIYTMIFSLCVYASGQRPAQADNLETQAKAWGDLLFKPRKKRLACMAIIGPAYYIITDGKDPRISKTPIKTAQKMRVLRSDTTDRYYKFEKVGLIKIEPKSIVATDAGKHIDIEISRGPKADDNFIYKANRLCYYTSKVTQISIVDIRRTKRVNTQIAYVTYLLDKEHSPGIKIIASALNITLSSPSKQMGVLKLDTQRDKWELVRVFNLKFHNDAYIEKELSKHLWN